MGTPSLNCTYSSFQIAINIAVHKPEYDNIIRVGAYICTMKRKLGSGVHRVAYTTDVKIDGIKYVVKEAKNANGTIANKYEYELYHTLKRNRNKYINLFPKFLAISHDGKHLLVEECDTAEQVYGNDEDVFDDDYQEIRKFIPDNHNGNWGYTKYDNRIVIMDYYVGLAGSVRHASKIMSPKVALELSDNIRATAGIEPYCIEEHVL